MLTAEEERTLLASIREMPTEAGPSHWRQHGSSMCKASQLRVRKSSSYLDHNGQQDFWTDRDFWRRGSLALFVLADYAEKFFNELHHSAFSTLRARLALSPKHPKVVGDRFFKHWSAPFGVLRRLIYDGGEFEREFRQEVVDDMRCAAKIIIIS